MSFLIWPSVEAEPRQNESPLLFTHRSTARLPAQPAAPPAQKRGGYVRFKRGNQWGFHCSGAHADADICRSSPAAPDIQITKGWKCLVLQQEPAAGRKQKAFNKSESWSVPADSSGLFISPPRTSERLNIRSDNRLTQRKQHFYISLLWPKTTSLLHLLFWIT